MEIFALLEACGCLLEATNGVVAVGEVFLWFFGKENRTERRTAKREGRTQPALNGWNVAFLVLFPITIGLLILVVIRYALR